MLFVSQPDVIIIPIINIDIAITIIITKRPRRPPLRLSSSRLPTQASALVTSRSCLVSPPPLRLHLHRCAPTRTRTPIRIRTTTTTTTTTKNRRRGRGRSARASRLAHAATPLRVRPAHWRAHIRVRLRRQRQHCVQPLAQKTRKRAGKITDTVEQIGNINWRLLIASKEHSVQGKFDIFYDTITDILDTCQPWRTAKRKGDKPWMTD